MAEPTNGELLVHILHIKDRTDSVHTDVKKLIEQGGNHEGRIALLEDKPDAKVPAYTKWMSMAGGFFGGLISGWLGGKAH